jgi:hypothetical protein
MKFTFPQITNRPLVVVHQGSAANVSYAPWHEMASSYWTAGMAILETIQQNLYPFDLLISPAIFLFRHAVELYLKGLLKDVISFQSDIPAENENRILGGHQLDVLWQAIDVRFLKISGHSQDEWWRRAGDIIQQLQALDPFSFESRYPESKKGLQITGAVQGICIDLVQFKSVLDELRVILEGAPAWLDALNDAVPNS